MTQQDNEFGGLPMPDGYDQMPPEQQVAVKRMATVMRVMANPPEGILSLFERLQMPWERRTIDDVSVLVIKWDDVKAGEQRNQEQGSILKRLYGKDVAQQVVSADPQQQPPTEVKQDDFRERLAKLQNQAPENNSHPLPIVDDPQA